MTEEKVRQIIREELDSLLKSDRYVFSKLVQFSDGKNIQTGLTVGTKIGTAAAQKVAFHGTTPNIQASHIADPSGAITDTDTEARAAIAAILVAIENKGIVASS